MSDGFQAAPGSGPTTQVALASLGIISRCLALVERHTVAAATIAAVTIAIIATAIADYTTGSFSSLMRFAGVCGFIGAAIGLCIGGFQMAQAARMSGAPPNKNV